MQTSLETLGELTTAHPLGPIHIHVAEQTKEVDDCLSWSGKRPVEWLLAGGHLNKRWCLIHATHMTPAETEALAHTGAVAGLCPTTEANLGDGIFDGVRYLAAKGRFGIGTDSHIRVDLAEELRSFEYSQRLRDRSRNVFAREGQSSGRLLFEGALKGGAQAIDRPCGAIEAGLLADIIVLDPEVRLLGGETGDQTIDSFVFSGDRSSIREVYVAGKKVVADGRHVAAEGIAQRFRATMRKLMA